MATVRLSGRAAINGYITRLQKASVESCFDLQGSRSQATAELEFVTGFHPLIRYLFLL